MTITEFDLDLAGIKIAALRAINHSPTEKKQRILCIHGWLDNANSFYPLLPLIKNADVVAIDLPGHGHSDHLSSIYTVAEFAHIVLTTAAALGWNTFTLMGHSLGGCIAPFSVVAAPGKIEKLILIEAAGPKSELPNELPTRLVNFHNDMQAPQKYQSRTYDSIDQAIASRLRANKMTPQSARLIVERQLQKITKDKQIKWTWRFDPKLRIASPSYFTEEQVRSVLAAVECPVLCILADNGYFTDRDETTARLNIINNGKVVTLAGHHHLHIDNADPVANAINLFLT